MVSAVALAIIIGFAVSARRVRAAKLSRATTVSLVIDDVGVSRTLADGRQESARWAELREVEVICTPVKTADGASAFVMLTESETVGCLVPLGVGHDAQLVVGLGRLPAFPWREWAGAQGHRPPRRTVVWRDARPQPPGGTGGVGTG